MMTQIKYMLVFLFGALYTICLGVMIADWNVVSKVPLALAPLSAAAFTMTVFLLSYLLRFFIIHWRKR